MEHLDLPFTCDRMEAHTEDGLEDVQDRGDCFRVEFDFELFTEPASCARPFVPNVKELQVALVQYMKDKLPELLECKVEKHPRDKGHEVLWTPPHCPQL